MIDNEERYKEIARQLSCPDGEEGLEVAKQLQETNGHMIARTLKELDAEGKKVLELGYANGKHVPGLMKRYAGMHYYGLEISETMYHEARKSNSEHQDFGWYDGTKIPMEAGSVSVVFSVNTVYFWEDIAAMLKEQYRVLDAHGRLVIAFRDREFMESFPLVPYGFRLYTIETLTGILADAGFIVAKSLKEEEVSLSILQEEIKKTYCIIVAHK